MQGPFLRKYGVETTIPFTLFEVDGVDFRVDAAAATADTIVMKDEGVPTACTNIFVDEGTGYSQVLTATEMTAARIVVYIVDSATKVWLDDSYVIETYGHASAMHGFDLNDGSGATLTEAGGTGDQLTAIDLPNQTMDIIGDITGNLSGSVGSVTGHTAQTGDSFARIGDAGSSLTAIDLPNQTMDITGSLSGSVGSVAGNVDGLVSGTVAGKTPAEAGDLMGLAANALTAGTIATGAITANAFAAGALTAGTFATDSIAADALAADAVTEIQSGLATEANIGIAGSSLTAIDLPNQTMDITGNLSGSVGSLAGHTVQTGDSFARIGAGGSSLTALPGQPYGIEKNQALSDFEFLMVDATDKVTPETGLSVAGYRSIDGGVFGSAAGVTAEVGNGIYQFDALAADTNGDLITWRFTATGAADTFVTFKTES